MKKKSLISMLLIVLCLATVCMLVGCTDDDDSKNIDRNCVRGMWRLNGVETVYVAKEYQDSFGEVTVKYSSDENGKHTIYYSYTPDKDDPADGPVPYSAEFVSYVEMPEELEPDVNNWINVIAKVVSDGKPGHTDGICSYFGMRSSELFDSYDSEGLSVGYGNSLVFSDVDNLYPVYAGSPTGYGHINDAYKDEMNHYIYLCPPYVTKEDYNKSKDKKFVIKYAFCTNAAQTVYEYVYDPVNP